MKIPLTIALLTYNRSDYLKEALRAILCQTYTDFELLVLDNASTDDTADVVAKFEDPRLIYIRQPPGGNSGGNWGTAVCFARGKYLLVTHDDDVMEPTLVEKEMAMIKAHPSLLGVAANVSLMDAQGKVIQPWLHPRREDRIFRKGEYILAYLEEKIWLPASTCLFRKDVLMLLAEGARPVVQGKRLHYVRSFAAGDVWGASWINSQGPIALIGEPLLRYRQHPGQDVRNVDHTFSLVRLFQVMECAARRNPAFARHQVEIEACLIRFQAQACMMHSSRPSDLPKLKRQVERLKVKWENVASGRRRVMDPILPFEILLLLLGIPGSLPRGEASLERLGSARNSAQSGFRCWLRRLWLGQSLFPRTARPRRIAILGSMLAGYLVALDAAKQGINVVCCLDSSSLRQRTSLVGIPIVPFTWLDQHAKEIDAVVLSSELGHEEVLRSLISKHLPSDSLPIYSWKDLAVDPEWEATVNA